MSIRIGQANRKIPVEKIPEVALAYAISVLGEPFVSDHVRRHYGTVEVAYEPKRGFGSDVPIACIGRGDSVYVSPPYNSAKAREAFLHGSSRRSATYRAAGLATLRVGGGTTDARWSWYRSRARRSE